MLFLGILVVLLLADLFWFANDAEWLASGCSLVVLVASYFMFPTVALFVHSHTLVELATFLGYYLGLGIGVAFIKWILFNLGIASKLSAIKKDYNTSNKASLFIDYIDRTVGLRKLLKTSKFSLEGNLVDVLTPRAKNYVGNITNWVLNWPIVAVDTVVADLVIKIGKHTAHVFDTLFSSIGRAFIGSVVKDMK